MGGPARRGFPSREILSVIAVDDLTRADRTTARARRFSLPKFFDAEVEETFPDGYLRNRHFREGDARLACVCDMDCPGWNRSRSGLPQEDFVGPRRIPGCEPVSDGV
jgi:hypothetical protein